MNDSQREQKVEAARARMAELGVKFLERTVGELEAIRSGLNRLSAGDLGALNEMRHLAHRMVGTGATLGFLTVAERARELEELAEECVAVPDNALCQRLRTAIERLAAEVLARHPDGASRSPN